MILVENPIDAGVIDIRFSSSKISCVGDHISQKAIGCQKVAYRIYCIVKAWLREFNYYLTTCAAIVKETIRGKPSEYVIPGEGDNCWRKENKGLYVAIHGLMGRPNIWQNQLIALRKQHPDCEIRLPYVPKRGNCSLEEAVKPIEAMVRDYIEKHPKKPVCLMGVSNGGRIVAELETRLRNTATPIKVSCISGALSGTKQMNLMDSFGLAKIIFTDATTKELRYQSKAVTHLMKRMRAPLAEGVERSYDFYVSPNDFVIKPYTGSLPILNGKNVKYCLVPGENHNSIVSRVSKIQVKNCIDWMKGNRSISTFHSDGQPDETFMASA